MEFFENIIPTTLLSSLTVGNVLQTLFVALLVGFGLQAMGPSGEPLLRGVGLIQKLVFRILSGILWLAPIGAFGAMAKVVGDTGFDAVVQLGVLMLAFYLTCIIFVFGVLGALLRVVAGMSIFKLVRYLAREYLLIVATSSSESALPRLIAKLEHAGVEQTTVGIVVPTGYSFNLDGTAIYLTMASLFIADAMGNPLSIPEQLSLLAFMIVASKGAAGVSGAGLATLAGGSAEPPAGIARRHRADRRHRQIHVRSSRGDQLLRQRRGHHGDRGVDQDDRLGAHVGTSWTGRSRSTNRPWSTTTPATGTCPSRRKKRITGRRPTCRQTQSALCAVRQKARRLHPALLLCVVVSASGTA